MTDAGTIIFVEDDDALRLATVQTLALAGISVRPFDRAEPALAAIDRDFDGIVVSDIRMPRIDGLQLLARLRQIDRDLPVILVTGHGDVPMAVAALREGASDFLTKPFAADHLIAAARRELARRRLVVENRRLRAAVAAGDAASPLIGTSPAIEHARRTIAQLAATGIDVLIEGETGTGKELAARLIHLASARRARPFVAIDCATLTDEGAELDLFGHAADSVPHTRLAREGRILAARGGTLLLDAVEAAPPALQALLLRLVEEREVQPVGAARAETVDLRIIATSTRTLADEVGARRFRADLYHRLANARLTLPPLRLRGDDPLILLVHFLDEATHKIGAPKRVITNEERHHLFAHTWPGNVRELRNYAYQLALSVEPDVAPARLDLRSRVAAFEAAVIASTLRETDGNVTRALDRLGLPRKTLYDKLARYGLKPADIRATGKQVPRKD